MLSIESILALHNACVIGIAQLFARSDEGVCDIQIRHSGVFNWRILAGAFRRADELGDAMDARCYSGSKNRTKFKKLKLGWRDLVAFLVFAALIAGVVLLNIYCADILPQFYEYIKLS